MKVQKSNLKDRKEVSLSATINGQSVRIKLKCGTTRSASKKTVRFNEELNTVQHFLIDDTSSFHPTPKRNQAPKWQLPPEEQPALAMPTPKLTDKPEHQQPALPPEPPSIP